MTRKFYFTFLAMALALAATVAFVIGRSATRATSTYSALSALPASDFVISVDVQRALSETLPSLLASNPELLTRLNARLEEFQQQTGINPHVFESIAIGGKLNPQGRGSDNGVVIARGTFNADELLNAAFTAAQKESRFDKEEQQYEGRTIYLISNVRRLKKEANGASKEESKTSEVPTTPPVRPPMLPTSGISIDPALYKNQPSNRFGDPVSTSQATSASPDTINGISIGTGAGISQGNGVSHPRQNNFAVAAVDANTIAVGSLESVRAAIDASLGRNRVDDELVRLASQSPGAVVSFSGRVPPSDASKQTADNSIERYFASIKMFYGSFSASGSEGETTVTLRTETAEQAGDISQALNSMKSLAAMGFAQSSGGSDVHAKSVADFLKGLAVTAQGNEVQINARFAMPSLAPFMPRF